jgi:hypothetical protein
LLTGMSWSRLRDTQGFGMQCASNTHRKVASHPGIMARSQASWQPFSDYHLLARGYCPLSLSFCLV